MFNKKYFWRGYLLGFSIASLSVVYMMWTINTTRSIEAIQGFDNLIFVSLKGETLTIKKVNSEPVFINYWATFCAPCIKEMPLLLDFSKKHPEIKMWLLTTENIDVIDRFVKKHPELNGLNFGHLVIKNKINTLNTIEGKLPSSFLVKSDGLVIWKNDGMLIFKNAEEMFDSIQKSVPEIKHLISHN